MTLFVTSKGYRKAFRTVFRTLGSLKNYKVVTFLRTFSPSHFENGAWNEEGNCVRTRPFTKEEMKLDGYVLEMYLTQVEELKAAEEQACSLG
ncbi:protein trichome birefringence-like 19 [Prunus yedoensis var. nudiflora]|uniref:Protein trichome birefringence-like 19 n=1 Tax=Prunus yedoensis var. nudiflora TaxID=2094558 RepID=A0A314Z4J9_PRUYE|nr:protein trichome birefringence-like 19 [Prunus yedoensis var. nudiflora]